MKLDWLRADIASARRASALLVLLLACSMLVNVTLAVFAMQMAKRERVVVVPPSISKTFWVESFGMPSGLARKSIEGPIPKRPRATPAETPKLRAVTVARLPPISDQMPHPRSHP